MADRGRDLKVSILSDASRFNLDGPADELDHLADAAKDSERGLDRLDTGLSDTDRTLRRLEMQAKDAKDELDRFSRNLEDTGRDAKKSADKVDDAFEAIARSSRTNLRQKLGEQVDGAKRKLREVGDEAKDTAREMFASFSSSGDLADAAQELSANAGAMWGPVGLAIGGALSAGLALFKQSAEELKETARGILDDLMEGAGVVSQQAIQRRLSEMGMQVLDLKNIAVEAKIPVSDFLLAVAGDPAAIQRTNAALAEQRDEVAKNAAGTINAEDTLRNFETTARKVTDTIGRTTEATRLAEEAYSALTNAQSTAAASAKAEETALAQVTEAYRRAEREMKDPVVITVTADTTAAERAMQRLRARYEAMDARFMP